MGNAVLDMFHIDEKTGKIFLTAKLNFEKTSQFLLVVKAVDGGMEMVRNNNISPK